MSTALAAPTTYFIDTNVFVYAFLASEPLKRARALELIEQALATRAGCVSYQVLQEFANVACRKFAQPASAADIKAFIDAALTPLLRVESSTELIEAALDLHTETGYSFYDCLMVAAALQASVDVLYSEDMQHGHLVRNALRIVNPFLPTADEH